MSGFNINLKRKKSFSFVRKKFSGLQHGVITASHPYGLPLRFKLMPQFLTNLDYISHAVGKWHLGCHRKQFLPTERGFMSHVGYWQGKEDYYDHTDMAKVILKSDMSKISMINLFVFIMCLFIFAARLGL